jgi:hypothetical protein
MAGAALLLSACGQANLDAGSDHPHGLLPIDERNPVILCNDGSRDNWQGEYAALLASSGQMQLVGIIVDTSPEYASLETNVQGFRDMVQAARASGMRNIPDPTPSPGSTLRRPADGNIDSTETIDSEGGRLIVETARRLSQPRRPIVVATGGKLTDVADAYLLDHAVAERVVVVSSLGHLTPDGNGALMSDPNGPIDAWADEIVARKFRYVQVNAYYAQNGDIPPERTVELPANPFGAWMTSKLGDILDLRVACDQNSIIASVMPDFALDVRRLSEWNATSPPDGQVPTLGPDANGRIWLVTRGDNAGATDRFWRALKDPATFGP